MLGIARIQPFALLQFLHPHLPQSHIAAFIRRVPGGTVVLNRVDKVRRCSLVLIEQCTSKLNLHVHAGLHGGGSSRCLGLPVQQSLRLRHTVHSA